MIEIFEIKSIIVKTKKKVTYTYTHEEQSNIIDLNFLTTVWEIKLKKYSKLELKDKI